MNKKPALQSALNLGYSNTPPKLDGVTLAWECATPSCNTETNLTRSFAPRNYPHTPEQIAEEIRVDEKGKLWWKKQIKGYGPRRHLDKPAGRLGEQGYMQIFFKGRYYASHTVAFCLYYNRWPVSGMEIDHINGIKIDNSKENLREVSKHVNAINLHKLIASNTSGHHGVNWNKQFKRWRATFQVNGMQMHEHFLTMEAAIACRVAWEKQYNYPHVASNQPKHNDIKL